MKQWVLVVKEMTGSQLESVVSTYSYLFNTNEDLHFPDNLKNALSAQLSNGEVWLTRYLFDKIDNGHYSLFNNN